MVTRVHSSPPSMASLWEAVGASIGSPPLDRPVPRRRSPIWESFCQSLENFLSSPGLLDCRGPSWLFRKLHSHSPPARLTWGSLLGELTAASAEAINLLLDERPRSSQVSVISWNARWLVDQNSSTTQAKRGLITSLLAKGYIVCVQETHWTETGMALWQHGLCCARYSRLPL